MLRFSIPLYNPARGFLLLIYLAIFSCSPGPDKKETVEEQDDDSFEQVDQGKEREQFIVSYTQPVYVDTSFSYDGSDYRAIFHHFCITDSNIIVPAKYNFDIAKDFVAHPFESVLTLISGTDTLYRTTIKKDNFEALLDSSLREYAVLSFPNFSIFQDSIRINYSISVPVTDVGIGVSIQFDKKGNAVIGE